MEGWYVAKIKPQKETCLTNFLSQWGVEVFFPRVVEAGKSAKALKPLFPTYVFCYLDPGSSVWPVVRWAPGMAYFLNYDGEPVCVPQVMIDYLKQRVNSWNERGSSPGLAPGDKVVVLGGPFSGLEGIFQRYIPGRQRCQVLLETLGRLGNVQLPEWDVKEVSQVSGTRQLGVALAS